MRPWKLPSASATGRVENFIARHHSQSDFGGVRINLANAEQVRDAFDLMMLRIPEARPKAYLRGGFVEKMGARGREVILGMTRDPQFGRC